MFEDDLLIRTPNGFELTLRGRKILDELEALPPPRMENLVAPALFDPMREKSHFRISDPDNVCTVVLPRLCRQYANGRYQVQFEFLPWQSGVAELEEHGAQNADMILICSTLLHQRSSLLADLLKRHLKAPKLLRA